jgi:DNA-binding NtrC family response regulator
MAQILIVDDEPIVCERLKAFLESDGHGVETIVDPAKAMHRLETNAFDIVISDIRMGEIDGIQVMEKVFQNSAHTKVIMITGYATLELAREALTKGAFDFIAKPFKMKEIRGTIKKAMESLDRNHPPAINAAGAGEPGGDSETVA